MNCTKRTLSILSFIVLLTSIVFTFSAQASLVDPTTYDVTVAKTTDTGFKLRFPDVVLIPQDKLPDEDKANYPEGKLLAAFYKGTDHYSQRNPEAIKTSSIQLVESKDSGKTWSTPKNIIDQSLLLSVGLATEDCPAEARDPNFFLLSDGTLMLTFFTTMPETINSDHAVYIILSTDGGKTWNNTPFEVEHEYEGFCAKRGDITQFANGDVLIPVYGDNKAYGILYSYNSSTKTFTKKAESEIIASNEPSSSRTPFNEVSFCATLDEKNPGTVYAFARQPGYVYISKNYGKTWSWVATAETPIHQPGLKLLPDGTIFATWAGITPPRPIYGKIFDPKLGWDATDTTLIYKYGRVDDMADPSGVLLADGKTLLTVWYLCPEQSICGTFCTIDELTLTMPKTTSIIAGQSKSLLAGSYASKAVLSSCDENVVSIKDGIITGSKVGSAVITATVPGTDIKRTCRVSVLPDSAITEDFENTNIDIQTLPEGWEYSPTPYRWGNSLSVYEDGANRAGLLYDSSSAYSTATAWRRFLASDNVTVSLKYKALEVTDSQGIGLCYGGYSPDSRGVVYLRVFNENDNLVLKYRTSSQTWVEIQTDIISLDTWYDIKLELTPGSDMAKVTFGTTVKEIPLINKVMTQADRLVVASSGTAEKTERFLIDDISILTDNPAFFVNSEQAELSVSDSTGTAFSGTVPNTVEQISLNVTTNDPMANVTIGNTVYNGEPISLSEGENTITLTVTANGTEKNYTVTVDRKKKVEISLGDKKDVSNVRFYTIDGVKKQVEENADNLLAIGFDKDILVEVTEKTSSDSMNIISSKYYLLDYQTLTYKELPLDTLCVMTSSKSIRTEEPMGVRFKADFSKAAKAETQAYNVEEYGFIIATQKALDKAQAQLNFDFAKHVTGVAYNKQDGTDIVYNNDNDDRCVVTGVLMNIPKEQYKTVLTAKMYTKINIDGQTFTVYSEPISASIYEVAKYVLSNEVLDQETKELMQQIVIYAEGNIFIDAGRLYTAS